MMRAWFMTLALYVPSVLGACAPEKDYVTMNSVFSQSDTRFPASDVHTFTLRNDHTITVTGFDSTRAIGYGFRCFERCRLGDKLDHASATVSGLDPGGLYRFHLWQVRQPEESGGAPGKWDNQVQVNGELYDTTMGFDVALKSYTTATNEGTVEFLFVDTNSTPNMGFSWLNIAKVCGCGKDAECPGGELCEGTEADREAGHGRCTPGGECAQQDYRSAEQQCQSLQGGGTFAGNAYCSYWPNKNQPIFTPLKMCCDCSGGMSWVKTPYQLDNGGYEWRGFGGATSDNSFGEVVLEVGAGHKIRGIMTDASPGKKTPKNIIVSSGATSTGPWTNLGTWKQPRFERVWTNLMTEEPFLQLSWEENYGSPKSKISDIRVKLGDRAVDVAEPMEGWTGSFRHFKEGIVASEPNCIIKDGCVSSPRSPKNYPFDKRCEVLVQEDTVLIATHFEVVGLAGSVLDDYFVIDSQVRRSSGLYTGSAGPYHVPVMAGDKLVWVAEDFEGAPGFRVCGYTPDGGELPTWPPVVNCSDLTTKPECKDAGCKWNKKKGVCKAKFQCASLKKGKCKKIGDAKGCEWNKKGKVCQAKGPE